MQVEKESKLVFAEKRGGLDGVVEEQYATRLGPHDTMVMQRQTQIETDYDYHYDYDGKCAVGPDFRGNSAHPFYIGQCYDK
ncbi:hypothetical protein J1614_012143 [Plenodomus biglobosus]|nr:hypothetical protein J1614_012143 [Plenodomus biglobosus]